MWSPSVPIRQIATRTLSGTGLCELENAYIMPLDLHWEVSDSAAWEVKWESLTDQPSCFA